MMMMFYSLMITLSMMFMWLKHPMSMGFILIMQTAIISIISGMMLSNFFFSYIIMIIMLSGALVLFIYMASIASNEKFKTSINIIIMFIVLMVTTMMITKNINMIEFPQINNYTPILSLIKLFNTMSMSITIMMIMYLLITMIIVSFIANTQEGPLRMKTYE
uniref:NADH dehydrogenase subunit 6 n=1 Tax=Eucorysses grandis TaxID=1176171 RepID=A0A2P1CMK2_9HEMI|nr:NADH dehydrogenase subunit 6 [Eucorysses grandis]